MSRNDYEPDVCFWGTEKSALFNDDQMQFPAPDLVVEVLSPSTAKNDRAISIAGIKFDDYESHGVAEYWLVDPEKQTVEQYVLENGRYDLRLKASEGLIRSVAVTDFQIPIRAMFDEDQNAAVLAAFWQS